MKSLTKNQILNNIWKCYNSPDNIPVDFYIEKSQLEVTGKIKNDPNYYPVTVSYRMKNGTFVRKKEYVRNTDIVEIKHSIREQKKLEKREKKGEDLKGEKVFVKWRGDSSITPFETEDAEIAGSDGMNWVIKLTKPFVTGNSDGYVYPAGFLLQIPKTNNPLWMKNQARTKVQMAGTPDVPSDEEIEKMKKEDELKKQGKLNPTDHLYDENELSSGNKDENSQQEEQQESQESDPQENIQEKVPVKNEQQNG